MARFIINPKVNNTLGLMDVITVPQGGTGVTIAGSVPGVFNAFVGSDLNTANGPIGLDGNGKIPVQYFPTGASGILIYDGNGFVPNSAISPSSGVGVFTGITGPSSVVVGETVTYTITNYDSFTNYNVTVSGGSVSVSGNLIAFTAPNTTGTVTLTLNRKTSSIPVIASRVNAPVITAPGNNAEGVSLKPTFTKSSFSVTGQAQTQTSVRWELSTNPAFTTLVDSYEGTSNYTSWTPSATLSNLTTYYVRVKDQGNISGYSNWSPVVSFTTVQQANFVAGLNGTGVYIDSVKLGDYIYVAGFQRTQGQGGDDALIVKYDLNGNLIWQRSFGSDLYERLRNITTDGTYLYIIGEMYSNSNNSYVHILAKYDTSGNLIWQRSLTNNYGRIYGLVCLSSYIYTIGATDAFGNYGFIAKWDLNGNLVWQYMFGSGGGFNGATTDGVYIYAIGNYNVAGQGQGQFDIIVAKYDTSGNLIWQRGLGSSQNDYGYNATVLNGYLYVLGSHSTNPNANGNAIIAKYDTNGNFIWQKMLGSSNFNLLLSITTDGTYLYASGAQSAQSQGDYDAFVVKLDADGNLIWQRNLGTTGKDAFTSVMMDGSYVYVCGCIMFSGTKFGPGWNFVDDGGTPILAKIRVDGAIAYGPLTGNGLTSALWSAPSLPISSASLTPYTSSFANSAASNTYAASTFTVYTPTLPALYSTF